MQFDNDCECSQEPAKAFVEAIETANQHKCPMRRVEGRDLCLVSGLFDDRLCDLWVASEQAAP